jgi:hypothetical protein
MILLYRPGSEYRPVARKEQQQEDDFGESVSRWWSPCFDIKRQPNQGQAQHCAQMIALRPSSAAARARTARRFLS